MLDGALKYFAKSPTLEAQDIEDQTLKKEEEKSSVCSFKEFKTSRRDKKVFQLSFLLISFA